MCPTVPLNDNMALTDVLKMGHPPVPYLSQKIHAMSLSSKWDTYGTPPCPIKKKKNILYL
jgi:hypothetical protein